MNTNEKIILNKLKNFCEENEIYGHFHIVIGKGDSLEVSVRRSRRHGEEVKKEFKVTQTSTFSI
jgi:hypothetical protein